MASFFAIIARNMFLSIIDGDILRWAFGLGDHSYLGGHYSLV